MGKRYFRVVPQSIAAKAEKLASDEVRIGCLLKVTEAEVAQGRFKHLGIEAASQLNQHGILPDPKHGLIAKRNTFGWNVIRRDLPKVQKTYVFYAPNFGDWTKGEHAIFQTRTVFQRDEILPPTLSVSLKVVEEATGVDRVFFLRAEIELPISKSDGGEFIFALSLCQETFGDCDVLDVDATDADFLRARIVDWEILPPGTADVVERLLSPIPGARRPPEMDKERADFFRKVEPDQYVKGTSGFTRYVGMLFDGLLLLENLSAGNAMYVIRGDWETLSKLPRRDLIRLKSSDVWRIVHNVGWQTRIRTLVLTLIGRDIVSK